MPNSINTNTRSAQVKEYILHYISQNQLQQNDKLPSEASIAKTLGVSRNTIREAYISLENEGVIIRRHGIGTFVAQSRIIQDSLNEFSPFAQIIHDGGYKPGFRTLSTSFVLGSPEVSDALQTAPSQKLRRINRIVSADDMPAIYVEDYLAPVVEDANLPWDKFQGNMVNFLAESMQTPLHQIRSYIRASLTTNVIAAFLRLPENTAVLHVRSTIFSVDNQPINYSKIYFNSNIVELSTVRMIR